MKRTRTTLVALASVAVACSLLTPVFAQLPDPPALPPSVNTSVPFTPVATIYQEDFEAGAGGFEAIGDSTTWEHGIPSDPPLPATGQGPNMWGTNLDGDYEHHECGFAQSPPIDLSQVPTGVESPVSAARLSFEHWLDVDQYDGAAVFISTDGENWDLLEPDGGYRGIAYNTVRQCFGLDLFDPVWDNTDPRYPTEGDNWRNEEFDLTPYLGGEVQLRWGFGSSGLGPARGWYVDDVAIQLGAGAQATVPIPGPPNPSVDYTPLATVYQEDFETSDGGWLAEGNGEWEWGPIAAPPQPRPGSPMGWGTNLDAAHDGPACGSVTSPAIEVPGMAVEGTETARLSFDLWRHTQLFRDGAILQASPDAGATWYPLSPIEGYDSFLHLATQPVADCLLPATTGNAWNGPSSEPDADDWRRVEVDVTPFAGNDVNFRVLFAADEASGHRGVYINDVLLTVGVGAKEEQFPPSVPAVGAPGWQIDGRDPSWEYGYVLEGPTSAVPAWGTNLNGDYNAFECSTITSPPIPTQAVPGLGRLTLTFDHHMTTYFSQAGGIVQVSKDSGASWQTLTPVGGYHRSMFGATAACLNPEGGGTQGFTGGYTGPGFETRDVRLDDYDGEVIQVRFAFGASSENDQDLGWYIRSVNLHRGLIGLPITPSSGSAPLGASGEGTSPFSTPADALPALLEKADDRLRQTIDEDPEGTFEVIVTGPAHEDLSDHAFTDRAEAMEELDARAEGFLKPVELLTEGLGGTVTASWSSAPAVKVKASLPVLAVLAQQESVSTIVQDDEESVELVHPIESDRAGVQNSVGRKQIQAEAMWDRGFRGEGVTVSIIDTGIDGRHEAFKHADGSSRIAGFADCQSGGCHAVEAYDDHGHGTHVGATAAGSSVFDDPDHGLFQETGVAPNATILGAKFLSSQGSGSTEAAIDALEWSYEQGADITSNSWGSSCTSGASSVLQSVRTLTDLGMLSVFAAGNSGPSSGTIGSPGCSESGISAGAVDDDEVIASFSSRGPCRDPEVDGESRICPDVVAKGKDVRSAIPRDGASSGHSSGYRVWSGTSMATPHVAGALALAQEIKREYMGTPWNTSDRAEHTLLELTSKDLGEAGPDNTYGDGLVQLQAIHDLVDGTGEAQVMGGFDISEAELFHGDETQLRFNVVNLGAAVVSGDFHAKLTDPAGEVTTFADEELTIGILEGRQVNERFTVDDETLMGNYTFEASYEFSWTNETGETFEEVIAFDGHFNVYDAVMELAIDGLPEQAMPVSPQDAAVHVTNGGNTPARDVTLEFTVPDRYQFLPGDNWDPLDSQSIYGDPAPDAVHENPEHGRVTLVYDLGTLEVEETFHFTSSMAATLPGEYRSVAAVKYGEDGGDRFANGATHQQNVSLTSDSPTSAPATGGGPLDLLLEKADAALGDAVTSEDGLLGVIVTGPPHEGLQGSMFSDRAQAMEELDRRAAPFMDSVETVTQAHGGEVVASWSAVPAVKVQASQQVLTALAAQENVHHMTLDDDDAVELVHPIESEDEQPGTYNTEGRNQLQAEEMWSLGFRGEGIRVSVIDTGIDARHEAFKDPDGASRVALFADCQSDGCAEGEPYDDHGHGTHVAGSAAGSDVYDDPDHGAFQETGVAPNATLLVAKFLNAAGSGSLQGGIDALNWSFNQDADITSNSWGSSCGSNTIPVNQAVSTFTDLGMLSVFAAGNSGPGSHSILGPACSESAVSVGAVDDNEIIASFSSRGPCRDPETGGDWRICPDVVAKGQNVRSALPRDNASMADASGYDTWSGTSMATPHVAGAVALAEQMKRHYTGEGWNTTDRAEKLLLEMTSKDLGDEGPDNVYGNGLPQLLAVHALLDETDEALVVPSFGVSRNDLYLHDETQMHFSVSNLGGASAEGQFKTTLTAPDGSTQVLADEDVTLGVLESHGFGHAMVVDIDTMLGTYIFDASYAYSWTNQSTGEVVEETIERSDDFRVHRPTVEVGIEGLEADALPAVGQQATVRLENTGNAPTTGAVLEFTVPEDYAFLPGDNWDPMRPETRYADPAPDRIEENPDFARVTLVYELESIQAGESFSFTTNLAGTLPGDYRSVAMARFHDEGGNPFTVNDAHTQQVGVGLP